MIMTLSSTPLPLFVGLGREERTKVGERSETGEGSAGFTAPTRVASATSSAQNGRGMADDLRERTDPMKATISEADFEALLRRTGIPLTPTQVRTLLEGYGYMEPLLELVRPPRERAAEPAHIFVPEPR
jgi:hypothetical protein